MSYCRVARRLHVAVLFACVQALSPARAEANTVRAAPERAAADAGAARPLSPARPAAVAPAPSAVGLGGLLGGLGETLGGLGETLGGLGGALGELGDNLSGTLGQFFDNFTGVLLQAGGAITPTPGAETFEGTLSWDGETRRYVGIRPVGAPAGAPVLVLLHPRGLEPGRMANLTLAGRLAADYGAWVYLPEAARNSWADDPATGGADDVGFLAALVARELSAHALDASRVYAAGYSNGGFMAERLACERPELLAGIALVAATLRESLARRCEGPQRLPVLMFNGTSDLITSYTGLPTLNGAVGTAAFWAAKNQCAENDIEVTALPDPVTSDRANVTLTRYRRCVDSTVALYTINNGGHTWPGTQYASYTLALGRTTLDLDATIELWQRLLPFSRPAAP